MGNGSNATQTKKGPNGKPLSPFLLGRGERIRTSDPLLPKVGVFYLEALK
jgi:hypothetical protein